MPEQSVNIYMYFETVFYEGLYFSLISKVGLVGQRLGEVCLMAGRETTQLDKWIVLNSFFWSTRRNINWYDTILVAHYYRDDWGSVDIFFYL